MSASFVILKIAGILDKKAALEKLSIRIPTTDRLSRFAKFGYALEKVKMGLDRHDVQIYGDHEDMVGRCSWQLTLKEVHQMSEANIVSDTAPGLSGQKTRYTRKTELAKNPALGNMWFHRARPVS